MKLIRESITMKVTVVLDKQREGGYTVHVPSLPGCISEGDTKQEALSNIKEAIELYLDSGPRKQRGMHSLAV